MPRRIKPRLGWRYPSVRPGVPDDQLKSIYSPARLAEIADEFGIPSEVRGRFGETVLRAGTIYKQSKPVADDRPTPLEVRQSFEEPEYHLTWLLEWLDEMDDVSWRNFWKAEQDIIDECIDGRSSAMEDIGAFRQTDPSEDAWEFYTHDDARPVLRLLRLVCERATADVPAPSRGPRRRIALRRWAAEVLDFWHGDLGEPVTVDHQAGQAPSRTYRFLARLLEPLDPEAVRYRRLATVLREARTRRRGHGN